MQLVYSFKPNFSAVGQSAPGSTSWTALTYPVNWPPAGVVAGVGASLLLETVNAAQSGPGDSFFFLSGQASAPSNGILVPGGVMLFLDGVPSGIWFKLVTSTDILQTIVNF